MGARPTASTGKRPGGGKGPPGKRAKPGPRPEKPPATKREKKAAARALKAARRPETFPVIEEMVRLWETLRDPKTPKPEREALVARILEKIAGRVKEFGEYMRPPGAGRSGGLTETEAVSHRASRVVQACLKYGTAAQRAAVAGELKGRDNRNLLELARNPYGHFLVRKLLTYAKKDELPRLVGAFRGRVPELLRHPAGCHVIDDLYALAPAALQATLVAEFYGPEVALFGPKTPGSADLPALLRGASAAQRATILGSLHAKLLPILEKGLVDALPVHVALREYLKVAAAAGLSEVADALAGQHLLHIVHTRPGAQAAAIVVGGATAKQRKRLARELKPHLRKVAFDDQAYLVLLAVLTLVDDTVMVGKTVVQELVPLLGELVFHKSARRVVLQLLAPDNPKYVPRDAIAFLSPDARGAVASARKPAPADPKTGARTRTTTCGTPSTRRRRWGRTAAGRAGLGGFSRMPWTTTSWATKGARRRRRGAGPAGRRAARRTPPRGGGSSCTARRSWRRRSSSAAGRTRRRCWRRPSPGTCCSRWCGAGTAGSWMTLTRPPSTRPSRPPAPGTRGRRRARWSTSTPPASCGRWSWRSPRTAARPSAGTSGSTPCAGAASSGSARTPRRSWRRSSSRPTRRSAGRRRRSWRAWRLRR